MSLAELRSKIIEETRAQIKHNGLLPRPALWRAIDSVLPPKTPQAQKDTLFHELSPRFRQSQREKSPEPYRPELDPERLELKRQALREATLLEEKENFPLETTARPSPTETDPTEINRHFNLK